jgi:hypothetical protein
MAPARTCEIDSLRWARRRAGSEQTHHDFSNPGKTKNTSHRERCVGAAISDVLQMRHQMDRGAGREECETEISP